MTPIAWVVEHSLQASERFRRLTVVPVNWERIKQLRSSIRELANSFGED